MLWKRPTAFVLSLVGIALSAYLTVVHYTAGVILACPEGTVVNCERVTTSPQSMFEGVPVPVLGLAWFAVLAALIAARGGGPLQYLRTVWALGGLGFVVYLVYAELFLVGSICLWCTAVHLAVFAVCLTVLSGLEDDEAEASAGPGEDPA